MFLDCLYDNDFDGLIIKGEPDIKDIQNTWNKIYTEYLELVNNGNYNVIYELTKEINSLHYTILAVDFSIKHLLLAFDQEIIDQLNGLGLRCALKKNDTQEEKRKKLKLVHTRSKSFVIQCELKQVEFDKLQVETNPESGRYQFYDNLTILGQHVGHNIREQDITVIQYCRDLKRLDEQYRQAQLKKAGT